MNLETIKAIGIQSKDFSKSFLANGIATKRCLKAIRTKSLEGLCDEIAVEGINENFEDVMLIMSAEEVERRLKSSGLWQIVKRSIIITPNFTQMLDSLLLGSFGSAEVENEIRIRVIKALEIGDMAPLIEPINMEWRNGECIMSAAEVENRLKEKGLWQFVEARIA